MSNRDRTLEWDSAVLRDYGLKAWYDNEPDLRRDAEFVVLDPEALANRCALLRSLGATGGAGRWTVEEVLLRGMHGASPAAIRAVMADPTALCDVHFKAWTSVSSPWAEAMIQYRPNRNAPTQRPDTVTIPPAAAEGLDHHEADRWSIQPRCSTTARIRAAAASNDEILYDTILGEYGSRAEVRGTIQLRRAHDDQPHSWWLTLWFPPASEQSGGRSENATAEYRDQIVILECPNRNGGVSRLEGSPPHQ